MRFWKKATIVAAAALTLGLGAQIQADDINYQGKLVDGGVLPTANYDFIFDLYDAPAAGLLLGTDAAAAVPVAEGLFTVDLTFPAGVFDGAADRWLQIRVRPAGGGAYTLLAPRQQILPAARAHYATNAGSFSGDGHSITNLNADNIARGTLNDARLSSNVALESLVNTFTQDQIIHSFSPTMTLRETGGNGWVRFHDAGNISEGYMTYNHGLDRLYIGNSVGGTSEIILEADGDTIFPGDILFNNDLQSITFPATVAPNDPMINMFASGFSNAPRMVLAHSPAFPTYGLQYTDSNDTWQFVSFGNETIHFDPNTTQVGIGTTTPAAGFELNVLEDGYFGSADLNGDGVEIDGSASTIYGNESSTGLRNFRLGADGFGILQLYDGGDSMVTLSSGGAGAASLSLDNSSSAVGAVLNGDSGLTLDQADGSIGAVLDGDRGTDIGGQLTLRNNTGVTTIELNGQDDFNTGGDIFGRNYDGDVTFDVDTGGTGGDGFMQLRSAGGTSTITFYSDYISSGDSRIITDELVINGGSDLSERFNVTDPNGGAIEPGMVVSIDPANVGKLLVSEGAYDRTVAGIISGANGIKPGLYMGQDGTEAEGDQHVALTGRVYVMCDASNGSIQAGDLLTTSDLRGHAMKVTDYNRAQGAIIGKAMSSLDEGTGLVLVLVSLQ